MYDTQHQNVEDTIAKLPLGSIQGQRPGFWNVQERDNGLGNFRIIEFVGAKEALQTFVVIPI